MGIKTLLWAIFIMLYGIAMLACIPAIWAKDLYLNMQILGSLALFFDGILMVVVSGVLFYKFIKG